VLFSHALAAHFAAHFVTHLNAHAHHSIIEATSDTTPTGSVNRVFSISSPPPYLSVKNCHTASAVSLADLYRSFIAHSSMFSIYSSVHNRFIAHHTAVLARLLAVSSGFTIMFHTSDSTFTPDFRVFHRKVQALLQNPASLSYSLVSNLQNKLSFHSHLSS
jgi:hypothetical protein